MKCMFAMGVLSSAARVVIGSSVQCGLRSKHLGICWKKYYWEVYRTLPFENMI